MNARPNSSVRDPTSTSAALDRVKPDAELFLREHVPAAVHDRQRAVRERLDRLERSRVLGDVTVTNWSRSVRLDDGEARDPVVDRLASWASRNGCDLEPSFVKRAAGSVACERRHEIVELPFVCLALAVDGETRAVFPHTEQSETRTVGDCLDGLERGGWRSAWFATGDGTGDDPRRRLRRAIERLPE